MVTIPDATWVDGNVDAGELRKSLGATLLVPGGPGAVVRPGRFAGPGTPLVVAPTAPATMAVLVKAGKGATYRGASYGPILGLGPDGDVTVPIPAAPASGSQWHRVYLLQRDTLAPANDTAPGAVVDVVSGTAAASPTAPSIPAGALLLGDVVVPAGSSTVTSAMVTDRPTYTAPRGGILPVANQAERVALQTAGLVWPTLEVLELDTGRRLWHDGTRFRYEGDKLLVAAYADLATVTAYPGLTASTSVGDLWSYNGTAWRVPTDRVLAETAQAPTPVLLNGFETAWLTLDGTRCSGGPIAVPFGFSLINGGSGVDRAVNVRIVLDTATISSFQVSVRYAANANPPYIYEGIAYANPGPIPGPHLFSMHLDSNNVGASVYCQSASLKVVEKAA